MNRGAWRATVHWGHKETQESSSTQQFKSINSSALSFFYGPYMTTGKTIALTRWTFVRNKTECKTKRIQVRLLCRFSQSIMLVTGLPWWLIGKEPACNTGEHMQCRRPSFNLWIGKILWRRKQQLTPYSCLENPMGRGVVCKSRT